MKCALFFLVQLTLKPLILAEGVEGLLTLVDSSYAGTVLLGAVASIRQFAEKEFQLRSEACH